MKRGILIALILAAVAVISVVGWHIAHRGHRESGFPHSDMTSTSGPVAKPSDSGILAMPVPTTSAKADPAGRQEVKIDVTTPVGQRFFEFSRAAASGTVSDIKSSEPSLVALAAAESPRMQGELIEALSAKYDLAKGASNQCESAILAIVLAQVHRHAVTKVPDDSGRRQQDLIQAGAEWSSLALSHVAEAGEPADCRAYLVDRVPDLLSLHLWFQQRISDPKHINSLPANIVEKIASLASMSSRSTEISTSIARYRSDAETLTARATEWQPIRDLLDRYVQAYNNKDTQALRAVFGTTSSANHELKEKTAEALIPSSRWTIEKYLIRGIQVQDAKASIEMRVQYRSRDGGLGKAEDSSFEARKGTDNVWTLD